MLEHRAQLLAATAVAVMGVLPLLWLSSAAAPEQPPAPTSPATTMAAPLPETSIVTADAPAITGLSEAVTRVLVDRGFASGEGANELPASVAAILSEHGVTLTVVESGG